MDARGEDLQPKRNNNVYFSLFFIAFMIAGSMLVLNLFIGVVIDNFNKIKESEEVGNLFVTDAQRNWMEMQHLLLSKKL